MKNIKNQMKGIINYLFVLKKNWRANDDQSCAKLREFFFFKATKILYFNKYIKFSRGKIAL